MKMYEVKNKTLIISVFPLNQVLNTRREHLLLGPKFNNIFEFLKGPCGTVKKALNIRKHINDSLSEIKKVKLDLGIFNLMQNNCFLP